MTGATSPNARARATFPPSLESALAERRPGHALPRAFSIDPDIHAYELEAIWRASWLFAGPSAQASEPGDFFRFDLGDDSIIVVRDADGALHALHNTCRHRGMPVCPEPSGKAKRWVCPYHQWTYALDGRLLGCGGMEEELGYDDYGLVRAEVLEVGGLAFVWAGSDPTPFGPAEDLARAFAPQGLERARLAHQIDYEVTANWKLVWENNRECWHCHLGHPQYVRANFDIAPDTERTRELARGRAREHALVLSGSGGTARGSGGTARGSGGSGGAIGTAAIATATEHAEPGLAQFPSPGRWCSTHRTPLVSGFVTESVDGQPVAPLMGDYAGYDVGTLRARTLPNFWCHASSDHAVLTRLIPDGPERTLIRVQWLVDRDAVEGRDYELERLLPFWQLTSEQDWDLCERNHAGVRSPAFVPGPYSRRREANLLGFVDWYLARLGTGG